MTPEMVNFVFSLPEHYLVSEHGASKAVFRHAMRGIVPDAILDRKGKIGFATAESQWLNSLKPWVNEKLNKEILTQIPVFQADKTSRKIQQLMAGQRSLSTIIWRSVNLVEWARIFNVSFS